MSYISDNEESEIPRAKKSKDSSQEEQAVLG
jgi:hypothetical protein